VNATPSLALGIDLGGTKIEARLLQLDGKEIWRQRRATPTADYAAILRTVSELVADARGIAAGQAFTVGVGSPGTRTASGLMKNCNSSCLNSMPLQADLEQTLGQSIKLANDANCLALAEATDGAGAGAAVVFAAILGTGAGAGIAVHGRVLTGPNGLAGEWGHNTLPFARDAEDPVFECYCGQRGCIETLVSGPGMARDHLFVNQETLTAEQIAGRAAVGDPACLATLARHTQRLARALASVINLLDPDVIVLGGGLSLMQHLCTEVPALWEQWVFSGGLRDPVRTRLLPSRWGDASGARGAAWLGSQG